MDGFVISSDNYTDNVTTVVSLQLILNEAASIVPPCITEDFVRDAILRVHKFCPVAWLQSGNLIYIH